MGIEGRGRNDRAQATRVMARKPIMLDFGTAREVLVDDGLSEDIGDNIDFLSYEAYLY